MNQSILGSYSRIGGSLSSGRVHLTNQIFRLTSPSLGTASHAMVQAVLGRSQHIRATRQHTSLSIMEGGGQRSWAPLDDRTSLSRH